MTSKEYLQQVQLKEAIIDNLKRDKEGITEMLYSLSGVTEGDRVQTSKNIDKFGTLYSRIDNLERQIDDKIIELIQFRIKVSEEINELKNAKYMKVLNLRYIHFQSWEEISADMDRSVRHIERTHGLALKAFQEKYAEMLESA
jgi:DNA-directed RNA polymerase specialized sigma24 family protein